MTDRNIPNELKSWFVPVAYGNKEMTIYPLNYRSDEGGIRVYMADQVENELERLRNALAGEVGLVTMLASCDPKPMEILQNHRHVEALSALSDLTKGESK